MARLTAAKRKALPRSDFALPSRGEGKARRGGYPIPDKAHARAALQRVSQFGDSEQKAAVRRKVKQRFPSIKEGGKRDK